MLIELIVSHPDRRLFFSARKYDIVSIRTVTFSRRTIP